MMSPEAPPPMARPPVQPPTPAARSARRLAAIASLALAGLLGPGAPRSTAAPAEGLNRKAIEALAAQWAKARPKTKFHSWDPQVRADILSAAKKLGPIPEGSLEEVRDLFWRALKSSPPGPGKKDKPTEFQTPCGRAWWIQKGAGGPKSGLVLGLHGGGEGAGDASEAAGKWSIAGC